jgi:O-antigen biosynthesis protein WbqV
MNNFRPKVAFAHDVIMAVVSVPLSMFLRLGLDFFAYDKALVAQSMVLFAVIAGVVFWSMRLYGGVWRYASMNDLMAITKAVTLAILVFLPVLFLMTRLADVPRSTPVITWLLLMVLLGGPRFLYRMFKDRSIGRKLETGIGRRVPVLLVGAGDTADLFIRAINHNPSSTYRAVGLVDEKGTRIGRSIHGVHVLGDIDSIPAVIERLGRDGTRPQRLIVTKENIDGAVLRQLLRIADELGISLARLPRMTDFRSGVDDEGRIRAVDIEDLLGRPQTVLDRAGMQTLIQGKRVLVTGAGGSIGTELARQIAGFAPASLCLLDSSEYALYAIDLEIAEQHPKLNREAVIADVRDEGRIARLMRSERPELVFHAAALKHVPIVEANPAEGVRTNVIGTRVVADCCRASGVKAMVLISTDKAVNPTSVMGATKRIAETYCQALDLQQGARAGPGGAGTRFITVRFGNVLGSTGSVVPLFQRQLAAGGPLTVTHPDMKRFFMTVREAVELVLEASVLGARAGDNSGKIYVLDMGEPVRILDLANQMILLAGLRPEIDIGIKITGPRPGEKLFEEVLHDSEPPVSTEYGGILLAAPRTADHGILTRVIGELEKAAMAGNDAEILSLIRQNVPEYQPGAGTAARAAASG